MKALTGRVLMACHPEEVTAEEWPSVRNAMDLEIDRLVRQAGGFHPGDVINVTASDEPLEALEPGEGEPKRYWVYRVNLWRAAA